MALDAEGKALFVSANQRISVVIITYNRAQEVLRTVERISNLPECPPIIVVDNGSVDGSADQLQQRFPSVDLIRLKKNIGAAARNIGAQRAVTPYVAFCDDDVTWAPGSLARAVDLLDRYPRTAVLVARVLVGEEQREDSTCAVMTASPLPSIDLPGRAIIGFLAGVSVFRRDAFLNAGGFEEKFFIGGEEMLLALDLAAHGWSLVYTDQLIAYHHPSRVRDAKTQRHLEIRNALWVAWLRRPVVSALRRTSSVLRHASMRSAVMGALDAVRELPWVLQRRRVIPPEVEECCRLIEAQEQPGPHVIPAPVSVIETLSQVPTRRSP